MIKRFSLLLLFVSFVLAVSANPIDKAEARLVAQEFVGIDDATSDDVPVAPYYIFSRGAGKGFVIVSGDDSTPPILGYTDQGDFVLDELPEQLKAMLENWAVGIGKIQAAPKRVGPKRSISERLETARRGVESFKEKWQDVPILCQTHWHQSSPYNDLCPVNEQGKRAVTGCVATAASQIIYYFRKDNPAELQHNTPTYSYGYPVTESLPKGTPIEYNLMKLSGSGTSKQNHAVAVLMYAIGTSSYLTYGESTGGQPDDCGKAMASQFLLDNDYRAKWNYSQQAWENLIYKSLKAGSPMLYGATAKDKSGGHAVVLDGYQSKTGLYHFNFGWGGQGDGWYTVDDENGMNGFPYDQRGCMNFRPRKPNLKAEMPIDTLYHRATATINVHVENNGTLPYSGISFYVSSVDRLPSAASKTDNDVVIPAGGSGDVTFTYRPSTSPSRYPQLYLFITDANKNILDSCVVPVKESVADLALNQITVDAGSVTTELDGMSFGMVNNTMATVSASFTNGEAGTLCQPTVKCQLNEYNPETKDWVEVKHTYVSNDVFEVGETRQLQFAFRSLQEGSYYKAYIDRKISASDDCELKYATADTVVYFTVRPSDFSIQIDGRRAVASGNWNSTLFENAKADSTVCSYDFTQVKELTAIPAVANPNAVFFTSAPLAGAANVVCDGSCDNLVIVAGKEFSPGQEFVAKKLSFVLPTSKAGEWCEAFVPFPVTVPYGIQARNLLSAGSSSMTSEPVRVLNGQSPAVFISAHDGLNALEGENVPIGTDSVKTALDDNVRSATVYIPMEAKAMLFGFKSGAPYFLPTTESTVAPFRTMLLKYSANGVRAIPISDIKYPDLADVINRATLLVAEYPQMKGTAALDEFLAAIKKGEDAFTFVTPTKSSEIREEIDALEAAIEVFLDATVTGIDEPATLAGSANGPAEYYSLSGVRLQAPSRGVVIVKRGNQVRKVVVK